MKTRQSLRTRDFFRSFGLVLLSPADHAGLGCFQSRNHPKKSIILEDQEQDSERLYLQLVRLVYKRGLLVCFVNSIWIYLMRIETKQPSYVKTCEIKFHPQKFF